MYGLLKSFTVRSCLQLPRLPTSRLHERCLRSMSTSLVTPHQGVTFSLKYKVDPVNTQKFVEALRKCWESTSKEPECLYFEVFHSPSEPGTFRLIEIWSKDVEWMEKNHLPREYYQQYRKAVEPLVLTRELEVLDRLRTWNVVDESYLTDSIRTTK